MSLLTAIAEFLLELAQRLVEDDLAAMQFRPVRVSQRPRGSRF